MRTWVSCSCRNKGSLSQFAKGEPGDGGQAVVVSDDPETGAGREQVTLREVPQPGAQLVRGRDKQRTELVDRLGTGLGGAAMQHFQGLQRLYRSVVGLGRGGGFTGKHCAGGGDRVHDIGLAITPADLPVRAHHLNDRNPLLPQMPGQAHPVGAGALDPDPVNVTEAAQPRQQPPIANRGGRELSGSQHTTDSAHDRGDVNVEVGIDATGDDRAWF